VPTIGLQRLNGPAQQIQFMTQPLVSSQVGLEILVIPFVERAH
jgi:hypothetical protein